MQLFILENKHEIWIFLRVFSKKFISNGLIKSFDQTIRKINLFSENILFKATKARSQISFGSLFARAVEQHQVSALFSRRFHGRLVLITLYNFGVTCILAKLNQSPEEATWSSVVVSKKSLLIRAGRNYFAKIFASFV